MSPVAHLRFLGDLDDLLVAEQRGREVAYPFAVSPAVKDAVEALGVPHTEVGALTVGGEVVGFDYRLGDGDRVLVHPRRPPAAGLPPRPEDERFVADVHLGRLARYLRLLGFDTRWRAGAPDHELAAVAAGEHRTLLTRDRGLLKRRAVTDGVLVRSGDPEAQAVEVVRRLGLAVRLRPFTRCMACNGVLAPVAKEEVAARLLPRTRAEFDRFHGCGDCGRVYWEGSHHHRLVELVARVREAAG